VGVLEEGGGCWVKEIAKVESGEMEKEGGC